MATISYDKEIQIFPEEANRFLDVLESQEKRIDAREELKKYFKLKESKFFALAGKIDIDETAVKALREVSKI